MSERCPVSTEIQAILFPQIFSVAKARTWLRRHNKKAGKVHRTQGYLRFRQLPPSRCRQGNFATIPLGRCGIKAVICCPKRR